MLFLRKCLFSFKFVGDNYRSFGDMFMEFFIYIYIYISPPMPPHVLCGLRGPPSWTWQECNRLLSLGRPWGAVTLSRWCVSGDRGGCSARRGLKPKVYKSTQTMVTAGIFPFKENSHGRAGNRTRYLMISSQRLSPLDHEAGLLSNFFLSNAATCPLWTSWSSLLDMAGV